MTDAPAKAVQERLRALGYYDGKIDGVSSVGEAPATATLISQLGHYRLILCVNCDEPC